MARAFARRLDAENCLSGAPFGPRTHATVWDRCADILYRRGGWSVGAIEDRAYLRDGVWPLVLTTVNALARLHGDRIYPLLGVPPEPIAAPPPTSQLRSGSNSGLWMMLDDGSFDWEAAGRAARRIDPALEHDLENLRADFYSSNYPYSMSEEVAGSYLYAGIPHNEDAPDSALALERLAKAGAIDAGGPVWYSVPR